MWTIPLRFPLKIFPWAISLSINILSTDRISAWFCDRLYFSYFAPESIPNRSLILSSWMKLIWVPMKFGLISILFPQSGKIWLIYKWTIFFCKKLFFDNVSFNFIVWALEFICSGWNRNNTKVIIVDWYCEIKFIIFIYNIKNTNITR